jgi:hypothetical protein
VWLYIMAAEWQRIAEEEAFVGRCGDVGDERGSRLIAARIVQHLMRLCFLIECRYPPYSKWFGTAFARLDCAAALGPLLDAVLAAADWRAREAALSAAYRQVATLHNALGVTPPLEAEVTLYHDRPYLVIHAARFANALEAAIADPEVRRLPSRHGSLNQVFAEADTLGDSRSIRTLRRLYTADDPLVEL